MEVNHFFSTPVFVLKDNKFTDRKEQLLTEIYAWRDSDKKEIVKSNQGGWHSDTKIFQRKEPSIRSICGTMINAFNSCTRHIAPNFDIDAMDLKGEGWVNINPVHAFNVPHDHPGFTWSGVYYVEVEDPSNKAKNKSRSGNIEFLDPRTSVAAFATDIATKSEYFMPKRTIAPTEGMIVIFPSYLRHWVYPNEDSKDRISIAMNFKYSPKIDPNQLLRQAAAAKSAAKKNQNKGPKR